MDLRIILALALLLLAPAALAAETEHIVYLHENPLHALPEGINARVGDTLKITVENPEAEGKTVHNFMVCGDGMDFSEACEDRWGFTGIIQPGANALVTLVAKKAGTFDYYCYIAGHKSGGMIGQLVVQGDAEQSGIPGAPLATILVTLGALALIGRRRA